MIIDYLIEKCNNSCTDCDCESNLEEDLYKLTNTENLIRNMADAVDKPVRAFFGKTIGFLLQYAQSHGVFINPLRYPERIRDMVIDIVE